MNRRPTVNRHHLLHSRASYESSRTTRSLREQESLIFTMDVDAHNNLHRETPPVALLGQYAALGVLGIYTPTFDPTKDIDNLCLAIDRATKGSRFHHLERELAGLCIEGIMLQKELIFDGITSRGIIL